MNTNTFRQRLISRYQQKLAKNLALQAEIERVLNKFPQARLEAIIQRARQAVESKDLTPFIINPEVLKLAARLEKRLIRLKNQSQNFEAILRVLQRKELVGSVNKQEVPVQRAAGKQADNFSVVELPGWEAFILFILQEPFKISPKRHWLLESTSQEIFA